MRLLQLLRMLGSNCPLMHHHVLREWNPYHLQNQLTLWSRVIPENCRHCTSPLLYPFPVRVVRLRLPPGWAWQCLPQCWYMYTSLYGVTAEDCAQSHNNYVALSPNICKTCRFIPWSLDPT